MKHLKKTAAKLDDYGRNGDTIVAHINPREAALLKALGGSASINPKTGLPEFFSESDPMGSGSDYGYDGGRTDADRAASENATNSMVGNMNADVAGYGRDEGARATAAGRAGGIGGFNDTRSGWDRFSDWVETGFNNAKASPVSTLANLALPGIPGVINGVVGLTTGKSLTDRAIGMVADITGFNGPQTQVADVSGKTTGAPADNTGPSGDKTDGPDKSGEGGDGSGSTNPFGSANSPLFKALLDGYMPTKDPWGNMGRRKTYGALTSSFSPYGQEYVTPWAYRG